MNQKRHIVLIAILLLFVIGIFALPTIAGPAPEIGCKNKNYFAKDSINEPGVERGHFQYSNDVDSLNYDLKILSAETFKNASIHLRSWSGSNPPVFELVYTQGWLTLTEDDLIPPYSTLTFPYLRLLMDYNMTYLNLTVESEGGATKEVLAPIYNNGLCILSDSLIMGTVFLDANENGVFDTDEVGIGGIEVSVVNGDTDTVSTDGSGMFQFIVAPGPYTVSVDPAGYKNTTPKDVSVDVPIGGGAFVLFGLNGTPPCPEPAIDIEKTTNGEDADSPPGPEIPVGNAVEWTYVVANTGNVDLTDIVVIDDQLGTICSITSLQPGESDSCTASGIAYADLYTNIGTVTAEYDGIVVSDEDLSHYFGIETIDEPAIDIEKSTNGYDADNPPGPEIPVGEAVEWMYVVTNTGNKLLQNVTITDDDPAVNTNITCQESKSGKITLQPLESITCTASCIATEGQYANIATASGKAGIIVVDDTDPSHYFGIVPDKAMIRGTAFVDENGNGQLDASESGRLENIAITLNISGSLQTTSTDSNGNYFFANLAIDVPFKINASLPAGYFRTTPGTVFNDTSVLMQFINFGYAPDESPFGVVFGTVYEDANNNQAQDIGEVGLVDVSVRLDTSSGTVESNTSKIHGQYTFRIDTDGTYYVIETDPPGYVSTTPNNVTVYLQTGSSGPSPVDFGDFHGARITGMVFNDTNVDGIKDSTEGGVNGATVTAGTDSFTTGDSGTYTLFVNATGAVFINETDPAGYVSTNATPGAGAVMVDANSLVIPDITWGSEYSDNDFGDVLASQVVTITGYVIDDTNANGALNAGEGGLAGADVRVSSGLNQTTNSTGYFELYAPANTQIIITETNPPGYISTNAIPGVFAEYLSPDNLIVNASEGSVSEGNYFFDAAPIPAPLITGAVFDDANENGIFDPSESGIPDCNVTLEIEGVLGTITIPTDSSGNYSFAIAPGINVTIRSEGPGGDFYPTTLEALFLTSPSAGVDSGNNFGYSNDTNVSVIFGIVFDDMNGNGTQEFGEGGLVGANVTFNGTTSFITSGNGLPPGTFTFNVTDTGIYALHEDNPPGYPRSTTADDVNVPVPSLGASYEVNFGDTNRTDTATIYGTVFDDCDGTGKQDPNEAGIEGVAINLTDASGKEYLNTTTKAYGQYSFGVPEGTYTVQEQDPAKPGFRSTTSDRVAVEVELGESYQVDFGDTNCPGFSTIMGTVFDDLDGNGVQNGSEPGIPDVTIDLSDDSQTVTDVYGRYQFRIVTSGLVIVTETDPDCYHSTTPNIVPVNVILNETYTVNFGDRSNLKPGVSFFGTVFDDLNVNATRDTTEPAIQGVTVTLAKVGDTTTNTFITNVWGQYTFLINETGEFNITEENPTGYVSTSAIPGHPAVTVVHNDRFTVNITDLGGDSCNPEEPLDYGDNLFGDVLASSVVNITGYVIEDLDRDGNWSGTEPGLPGALVNLSSGMSQTTAADGYFELYAPADTSIIVTETNPPNYISTNVTAGDFATIIDFDTVGIDALSPGSNSKGTVFLDTADSGPGIGVVKYIRENITGQDLLDGWYESLNPEVGTDIEWAVIVANYGSVPLTITNWTDDYNGTPLDLKTECTEGFLINTYDWSSTPVSGLPETLVPGYAYLCIIPDTAQEGRFVNNVTVEAEYMGQEVNGTGQAGYLGIVTGPGIGVVKYIRENITGQDLLDGWYESLNPEVGTDIEWAVIVANYGSVPLTITNWTDDYNGTPLDLETECTEGFLINISDLSSNPVTGLLDTLVPGYAYLCIIPDTAQEGRFVNNVTVEAEYMGQEVNGTGQAGYVGMVEVPSIEVQKWIRENITGQDISAGWVSSLNPEVGTDIEWGIGVLNIGIGPLNITKWTDDYNGTPLNLAIYCSEGYLINLTDLSTTTVSGLPDTLVPGYEYYCIIPDSAQEGLFVNNVTVEAEYMGQEVNGTGQAQYYTTGPSIEANLTISKTYPPGPYYPYDEVVWNITVTNNGPADAYGIKVTDSITLEGLVSFDLEFPDSTYFVSPFWVIPYLENGNSTVLEITTVFNTTGDKTNNASIIESLTTDPDESDNNATATVTISEFEGAAIRVEKYIYGADADTKDLAVQLPVGTRVNYTFVVANIGTLPLQNITLTDDRLGTIVSDIKNLGAGDDPLIYYREVAAESGLHGNNATVTARHGNIPLSDNDSAWYIGFVPGAITGTAFVDLNQNGILDPGETGIPDVEIELKVCTEANPFPFPFPFPSPNPFPFPFPSPNPFPFPFPDPFPFPFPLPDPTPVCTVIMNTTTDANGNYTFTNLPAETYTVSSGLPAGYLRTTDADVEATVIADENTVVNFGFMQPEFANITACKKDDLGNNLSGWKMILGDPAGTFTNDITEEDGCTVFTVFESGTYTLSEDMQQGWVPVNTTSDPVIEIPVEVSEEGEEYNFTFINEQLPPEEPYATVTACKKDELGDNLTQWVMTITNGTATWSQATNDMTGCTVFSVNATGTWTLSESLEDGWYNITPTETEIDVTTLSVEGTAYGPYTFINTETTLPAIGGRVYYFPTYSGIPGVMVNLSGTETRSTMTNADGIYLFGNLATGGYTVEATDPDYTFVPESVTLDVTEGLYIINFAAYQPNYATITACKKDELGNNLSGWLMILGDPAGAFTNGTTGEDGCTVFTVSESGTYTLSEDMQQGWVPVNTTSDPIIEIAVEVSEEGEEYNFTFINEQLPPEESYATVTACKQDELGDNLTQWVMTITNGTATWSQATNDTTGCTVFSVNATGIWTVSEEMKDGWYNITPTETGIDVTTLSVEGTAYGPYTFINTETPPEFATITACKKDDLGNNLSGWQMNIWREEDEYYRKNWTTGEDGCTVFTVETGATYTLFETQKENWTKIEPIDEAVGSRMNWAHYEVEVTEPKDYRYTFVNEEVEEPGVYVRACKTDAAGKPLIGWVMVLKDDSQMMVSHQSGMTDDTGCTVFTVVNTTDPITAVLEEIVKPGWVNYTSLVYNFEIPYNPSLETYEHTFINLIKGPAIDIEKSTNGEDADEAPGPSIKVGTTVNWSYVVTNTGSVPLVNLKVTDDRRGTIGYLESLGPGQSMTFYDEDTAKNGPYANIGNVTAWYVETMVSDEDASHYTGTPKPTPTPTPRPPSGGGGAAAGGVCDFYENGTLLTTADGKMQRTTTICAWDGIGKLIVSKNTLALDDEEVPLPWARILVLDEVPGAEEEQYVFMGTAYETGPDYAAFNPTIELRMEFNTIDWKELSGKNLVIRYWNNETGTWEDIPTRIFEKDEMVNARIERLGIYGLFEQLPPATPPIIEPPIEPEPPLPAPYNNLWWIGLLLMGLVIIMTYGAYREGEE